MFCIATKDKDKKIANSNEARELKAKGYKLGDRMSLAAARKELAK